MIQKPNLLLDVDEVICFEGFLDAVNDFLGTTYQIDDFTDCFIAVSYTHLTLPTIYSV